MSNKDEEEDRLESTASSSSLMGTPPLDSTPSPPMLTAFLNENQKDPVENEEETLNDDIEALRRGRVSLESEAIRNNREQEQQQASEGAEEQQQGLASREPQATQEDRDRIMRDARVVAADGNPKQRIKMWCIKEQRPVSGTASPYRMNLLSHLKKKFDINEDQEIYTGQDKLLQGGITRQRVDGKDCDITKGGNVAIWNKARLRKTTGRAAPLIKNLGRFLAKYPQCEVYNGQDKKDIEVRDDPRSRVMKEDGRAGSVADGQHARDVERAVNANSAVGGDQVVDGDEYATASQHAGGDRQGSFDEQAAEGQQGDGGYQADTDNKLLSASPGSALPGSNSMPDASDPVAQIEPYLPPPLTPLEPELERRSPSHLPDTDAVMKDYDDFEGKGN
eukprot:Plantae.Rhodophyta-Hildenbrandia_rubra.ctg12572.p1 GENE.Plantae.Rhodophyta-Hildenbrandia_rubra.ctg12572~~Plantae.Rhodophyta-Hildenbrandia_rubra.ctg12572.p1  ORF type:complete len:392 (-),score=78.67 Plantae.Rhodophyta-Hildenbrandia_rubra.ctg12572:1257-2432(-)